MAKKIVKKAPAKKPAVKKAAVKPAVTAKPAVATAPVATPVAAPTCGGNCGCGCKGGFGRFVKKLIVFLIIFALGFAAGKFCDHAKQYKMMGFGRPEFVNGCMDLSSIKCPKMLEKVGMMDTDADGCITKDEFRAAKKAMRGEMRRGGCMGECSDCGAKPEMQ